MFVVLYINLQT